MPLSAVGLRKDIQDFFRTNPLGWGTTFQAHPVSCICAYEVVRHMIDAKVLENVKKLEPVMRKRMDMMIEKHACIRQGRL